MIIKNIWSEERKYPSLDGLKLLPGETADIGSFTSKQLSDCQELQSDFTRGYCVCIGKNIEVSTREGFLKEARNRTLGIEHREGIKIPGKPKIQVPNLSSFSKRDIITDYDKQKKEQEKRGYKEVFGSTKPKVIEEEERTEKLIVVDKSNGQISVTPVPETYRTIIDLEPFKLRQQTEREKEKNEEMKEILESIKDKDFNIIPICGGINRMNRGCNKRAVRGYKHCIKHMSAEERIDYQSKKRGEKFE